MERLIDACKELENVIGADAAMIPGPPPDHRQCLVINVQISELHLALPASVLLEKANGMSAEVLNLAVRHSLGSDKSEALAVSVVVEDEVNGAVRVLSTTISSGVGESCLFMGGILSEIAETQSSMIPAIDALIRAD